MTLTNLTAPGHNLTAHIIGTGEFSFSAGATTAEEARAQGYYDIQNITAFTPTVEQTIEKHVGSYRGVRTRDKQRATQADIIYKIKSDSWTPTVLSYIFGATLGAAFTQSSGTAQAADSLDFNSTDSDPRRWYDVLRNGVIVLGATSALVFGGQAIAVTADNTTETFTDAGHGLTNGQAVKLGGTAPAGLTAGTVYYVVNASTNTFQLSSTIGGAAETFTDDGTSVTYDPELVQGTDIEFDLELSRIRFIATQTGTVSITLTYPAIAAGDNLSFLPLTPLADIVKEGYGRLVIYDQEDSNRVVLDHAEFKCSITAEGLDEVTGTSWAAFTLNVEIPKTAPGIMRCRGAGHEQVAA